MPAGDSPCVLFSAHKMLKQKKLANVPSLGFGALLYPGREISPGPQLIQRDPHRFKNCGAYANLYCKIFFTWLRPMAVCNLPETEWKRR